MALEYNVLIKLSNMIDFNLNNAKNTVINPRQNVSKFGLFIYKFYFDMNLVVMGRILYFNSFIYSVFDLKNFNNKKKLLRYSSLSRLETKLGLLFLEILFTRSFVNNFSFRNISSYIIWIRFKSFDLNGQENQQRKFV